MSALKVAIIVLILLVVLFVAGLGLGAHNGNGNTGDTSAGWLDRLQSLINHPKQLTARDMAPQRVACIDNLTMAIAANATCDYTVAKTKAGIRRASLIFRTGTGLRVQKFEGTNPANMPLSVNTTLPDAGKRTVDVDFYKNGGVLRLTCTGAIPCRVDLKT
jgi:hypothetical protein